MEYLFAYHSSKCWIQMKGVFLNVVELTATKLIGLHTTTYPDPITGPNDVLIRLLAASLNLLDLAVA